MKHVRKIERRSECPISFGLDIFGDKWTLLVLRDIMFYGKTRYSDFVNSREHIATNILADRLDTLGCMGIIKKRRDQTLKNQYIYGMTQKGKDLLPILIEMVLWGIRYDTKTPVSGKYLRRVGEEKKRLMKEIAQAINKGTFCDYRKKFMGVQEPLPHSHNQ